MALDLMEQEAVDTLKAFWQKWGVVIVVGVSVFVVSFAGFQYWEYHKKERAEAASALLETIEKKLSEQDLPAAEKAMVQMQSAYAGTPFSVMAALYVAKAQTTRALSQADKGAMVLAPDTEALFSWAVAHADEAWERDWARIQWAQALLTAAQYAKVIELADRRETVSATPALLELKGDALLHNGQKEAARSAYSEALSTELPSAASALMGRADSKLAADNPMLKIKLQALGGVLP